MSKRLPMCYNFPYLSPTCIQFIEHLQIIDHKQTSDVHHTYKAHSFLNKFLQVNITASKKREKYNQKSDFLYVFLTPPALSGVPVVWVHAQRAYSLSSLTGTHFPSPMLPQVLVGAARHLEHTNNIGNLGTGTPIWSPQGCHNITYFKVKLFS